MNSTELDAPAPRDHYHHGDLKAALIAETERMIDADQLDQVTLNELGKRLGVARSAPYRHFASKQELLAGVAARAFERMRERLTRHRLTPGLDPLTRFRNLVHDYMDFAIHNRDCYRLMYRESLVGENGTPELDFLRDDTCGQVAQILQESQDLGLIHAGDVDAQLLFSWAPFHGMASLIIDRHLAAEQLEALLDWSIDGVLRGLGADI